jgi:hypothetical protein
VPARKSKESIGAENNTCLSKPCRTKTHDRASCRDAKLLFTSLLNLKSSDVCVYFSEHRTPCNAMKFNGVSDLGIQKKANVPEMMIVYRDRWRK